MSHPRGPAALFDALFCNGEESEVWFAPASLARAIGATEDDVEDALSWLQTHGRIAVAFDGQGGCCARRAGVPPSKLRSVRRLLREQGWACAECKGAIDGSRPTDLMVDYGKDDGEPHRVVCEECYTHITGVKAAS